MRNSREFPFERARRVTAGEVEAARRAIERLTGKPRPSRGRPPKETAEKYRMISIRIHPRVLAWARRKAGKRGVGYQTVINDALFRVAERP